MSFEIDYKVKLKLTACSKNDHSSSTLKLVVPPSITENSPEKSAGDNKNNELEETKNTDEEEGKDIEISADKKIEVDNEQGVIQL